MNATTNYTARLLKAIRHTVEPRNFDISLVAGLLLVVHAYFSTAKFDAIHIAPLGKPRPSPPPPNPGAAPPPPHPPPAALSKKGGKKAAAGGGELSLFLQPHLQTITDTLQVGTR